MEKGGVGTDWVAKRSTELGHSLPCRPASVRVQKRPCRPLAAPAVALVYYFFDPHGMTDDPHLSTVITTTMVRCGVVMRVPDCHPGNGHRGSPACLLSRRLHQPWPHSLASGCGADLHPGLWRGNQATAGLPDGCRRASGDAGAARWVLGLPWPAVLLSWLRLALNRQHFRAAPHKAVSWTACACPLQASGARSMPSSTAVVERGRKA